MQLLAHGNTKHGMFGTRTYNIWGQMVQRCSNEKATSYPRYGGRGIKVCERWRTFENVLKDMGPAPPGLTLERKNNNGDYAPGNCVWATRAEQSRNRRNCKHVTVGGKTLTIDEWSRELHIPRSNLYRWHAQGKWPTSEILSHTSCN
jgi:hypothetical protein